MYNMQLMVLKNFAHTNDMKWIKIYSMIWIFPTIFFFLFFVNIVISCKNGHIVSFHPPVSSPLHVLFLCCYLKRCTQFPLSDKKKKKRREKRGTILKMKLIKKKTKQKCEEIARGNFSLMQNKLQTVFFFFIVHLMQLVDFLLPLRIFLLHFEQLKK